MSVLFSHCSGGIAVNWCCHRASHSPPRSSSATTQARSMHRGTSVSFSPSLFCIMCVYVLRGFCFGSCLVSVCDVCPLISSVWLVFDICLIEPSGARQANSQQRMQRKPSGNFTRKTALQQRRRTAHKRSPVAMKPKKTTPHQQQISQNRIQIPPRNSNLPSPPCRLVFSKCWRFCCNI